MADSTTPPRPRQRKAALAAYRPLPFPSPFGPAFVLDELPPPLRGDDINEPSKRDSGWSEATLTWDEFALQEDGGKKLAVAVGDPGEGREKARTSWSSRARDRVDRWLGPRLTEEQVRKYTEAYSREGYGVKSDPYIVRWLSSEEEPSNALLWSSARKWCTLFISGGAAFVVSFASSVFVGGVRGMQIAFQEPSTTIVLLALSVYVAAMGLGPMLWAPLSELIGRRPVFIATFIPFFFLQLACALASNVETMIICRLFAGLIGSAPLTNSAGIVGDVFTARERGLAMAVYALMPFLGPVFGPIVGGYVGEWDWRFLFWITMILAGLFLLLGSLIPETHAPVILRRRALALSLHSGNHVSYSSLYSVSFSPSRAGQSQSQNQSPSVQTYLLRPFVLLFHEPIVLLFALYAAIIYGILYLMFAAVPVVYVQNRGWSPGEAGLPFIAVGVGMGVGMVGTVGDSVRYNRKLERERGRAVEGGGGGQGEGQLEPEERLKGACVGGMLLPLSLAFFALTASPSVHWSLPTLAGSLFGCAMLLIFMGGTAYLVDVYLTVAASAMAANSFMRSLFAAAFPLFTLSLFHSLGASWSLGLLAFVTLLCAPIPFAFYFLGPKIRKRSPFAAAGGGLQ